MDSKEDENTLKQTLDQVSINMKRPTITTGLTTQEQQSQKGQILTKNELLLISLQDRISKKMLTHSKLQKEAKKLE